MSDETISIRVTGTTSRTIDVRGTSSSNGVFANPGSMYYEELAKGYATQAATSATLAGDYAEECENIYDSVAAAGTEATSIIADATSESIGSINAQTTEGLSIIADATSTIDQVTTEKISILNSTTQADLVSIDAAKTQALNTIAQSTSTAQQAATDAGSYATQAATSEDNAEIWAEGTDEEVQALGGVHSAKGWAEESATGQVQADFYESNSSSISFINNKPQNFPIGYGIWSERPIDRYFTEVTDNFVNSETYPDIWNMLMDIIDGTKEYYNIKVLTTNQVQQMRSATEDWKLAKAELEIAYCYIVDLENNSFKFPRCLPKELCITVDDVEVIGGQNSYGGCYCLTANGKYTEYGFFMRIERATKTVDDDTYDYYKPTQWNDSTIDIDTETVTPQHQPNSAYLVNDELQIDLEYELLNDKYSSCYNTVIQGEEDEDGFIPCSIDDGYNNIFSESKTSDSLIARLCLYDEEYDPQDTRRLSGAIKAGENEAYITYCVNGYAIPPQISEYNINKKLYIKVK